MDTLIAKNTGGQSHKPLPSRLANINISALSRYLAASLGVCAIIFAAISLVTNMNVADIVQWIAKYFGLSFSIIYTALVLISGLSLMRLHSTRQGQINALNLWHQVGIQAANGISTLALTFTLLGISLGIGSLSEQSLTPENVNNVISILTTQFSMAFMTTVIGLPTATGIRAWLSIVYVKRQPNPSLASVTEELS